MRLQAIQASGQLLMPEMASFKYLAYGDGATLNRAQKRLLDFVQTGFKGTTDASMEFEVDCADSLRVCSCDLWCTGDSTTSGGRPWALLTQDFADSEDYKLEQELDWVRERIEQPYLRMTALERLDDALRLSRELLELFAAGEDASAAGAIRHRAEDLQEEYDSFFFYATMSPSDPDTVVVRISDARTEPREIILELTRSEGGLEEPLYGISIRWTPSSASLVLSDTLSYTGPTGEARVTVVNAEKDAALVSPPLTVTAELALGGSTRIARTFPIKIIDTGSHTSTRVVFIEPEDGCFDCGDQRLDPERPLYAREMERVELRPFWIEEHEVTIGQYLAFAAATNRASSIGLSRNPDDENLPATLVSFDDACAYCAWIDRRLPSECEWELAARGTERYLYARGNESSPGVGVYDRRGPVDVPTRSGDISPFNVHDMAGNVSEWCTVSGRGKPVGAEAGPVICGGSYLSQYCDELYLTYRYYTVHTATFVQVGFRCAEGESGE